MKGGGHDNHRAGTDLKAMQRFTTEVASWNQRFSTAARSILNAIMDERLKTAIRDRALTLLHAR